MRSVYTLAFVLALISCNKNAIKERKNYNGEYHCEVYSAIDFTSESVDIESYSSDTIYYDTLHVELDSDGLRINEETVSIAQTVNDSTFYLTDNWDNSSTIKIPK